MSRNLSRRTPILLAMAVAAATSLSAMASHAQGGMPGSTRPIQLVVSGGLTLPSGDLKDFHDTGFHYDASLIFRLPGLPIALRPELSLTTLKFKQSAVPAGTPGVVTVDDAKTQLLSAMGNIEIPIAAGLYALAGIGALNADTKIPNFESDGETALTFGVGAGYRFQMGRAAGFVEARLGTASYDKSKTTYSKAQFIPLTFGLVF